MVVMGTQCTAPAAPTCSSPHVPALLTGGVSAAAGPRDGTGAVRRRHHIEAAIVRIDSGAARSRLQLYSITEVTRQLSGRFQPQPSDVKKRMESLDRARVLPSAMRRPQDVPLPRLGPLQPPAC
jgi:hypothetical protein